MGGSDCIQAHMDRVKQPYEPVWHPRSIFPASEAVSPESKNPPNRRLLLVRNGARSKRTELKHPHKITANLEQPLMDLRFGKLRRTRRCMKIRLPVEVGGTSNEQQVTSNIIFEAARVER